MTDNLLAAPTTTTTAAAEFAQDNSARLHVNDDGEVLAVKVDPGSGAEFIERGRLPEDQTGVEFVPLTEAERAQVYEGAAPTRVLAPGITVHGTPTDAQGRPITGGTLAEQTLIGGQPAVVRVQTGDEPPAGYVLVNRKQRRELAKKIKQTARRQGKAGKRARGIGFSKARGRSASACSRTPATRALRERGVDD